MSVDQGMPKLHRTTGAASRTHGPTETGRSAQAKVDSIGSLGPRILTRRFVGPLNQAFRGLLLACLAQSASGAVMTTDWLLDPAPFRAQIVHDDASGSLVLENGLVRRVIRLTPNAASVALENLTSGEQVLRAVGPEARVTLNGTEFAIGGLEGQPINNYIKTEWLPSLRANPNAYRFAGWKEGPMEARFAWKKRHEWLSRDLPWPPPGRHLVMTYVPPELPPTALSGPVMLDETFTGPIGSEWRVLANSGLERASFRNEGKTGEIMACAAMAVCAEHAWPVGAVSVEVLLDSGDDRANDWGPGLALMWGDRVVPFILNAGWGTFSLNRKTAGTLDRTKPCTLRVRVGDGQAICEAIQAANTWQAIGAVPCPKPPTALRVGKVGLDGSGRDAGADKTVVRCHITRVTWRGAESAAAKTAARLSLPTIEIHYEIYDGLPLLSKWLVVRNQTAQTVRVNRFVAEELRLAEPEPGVNNPPITERPNLWIETDLAYGDSYPNYANPAVTIEPDPDYRTQIHYNCKTPCLLRCQPSQMGPDQDVPPGASFESFRAFVLLLDSTERERRTLAQRRMYRTIAPWSQENPLMFHKLGSDPATVRDAIAQAAEVGFELVIMSFGSGFNLESRDPQYQEVYRGLANEAKAKGIALGGYSLLASRGAADARDNTQGSPPLYGTTPCLGARWGQEYLGQLRHFLGTAGLGLLEHDGSYPGDRCAATNHPGHHGLADSQWVMWRAITDFYKWCRSEGIYLNIPDWYYLSGGSKCAMHYRESNWSLPRAEQELIERQNIFDGTWQKTPSMGWMFVPLSEYQGGGAAATIEPLDQHRDHYEARLANLLGAGVQACYRGPRLYDTDATKALVKKWVAFYKAHRQVLDSDLIHLRRANGRDWDGWLHVNPQGKEKGLLMLFNPLATEIRRTLTIPLYYTGLDQSAAVRERDGEPVAYRLDRQYRIELPVVIPAHGFTWFVLE